MRRYLRLALHVLLVMISSVITAYGDTHWVNINGENTPPYSSYATGAHYLQDAILVLNAGDTLMVAAGVYDLDTTVYIPSRVVWAGVDRDSVIINWNSDVYQPVRMIMLGDSIEVYRLEFNNPWENRFTAIRSLFLDFGKYCLKVHDCRFNWLGLYTGGAGEQEIWNNEFEFGSYDGIYFAGTSIWIHHNTFHGDPGGVGVSCSFAGSALIEHNVFNEDPAGRDGWPEGVFVYHATFVEIRNNLMINNKNPVSWDYALGIVENNTMIGAIGSRVIGTPIRDVVPVFLRSYETLTIRNNAMIDFAVPWEFGAQCETCDTTGLITFVHNAFWPPKEIHYQKSLDDPPDLVKLLDSANFTAYPMFIGDSSYQLQMGSPLIDAGDPTVFDIDGSRSDIGMYGGPRGSTYTYLQLGPEAPESLWVTNGEGLIQVTWTSRPEADLAKYTVGRGDAPGFWLRDPKTTFDVGRDDTTLIDSIYPPGIDLYYVVTAVDSTGHGSPPSPEGSRIISGIFEGDGSPVIPLLPRIVGTYPNPFNSSTTIEYNIPNIGAQPAQVQLLIYDILGRKTATIVHEPQYPGYHQVPWDGRTDAGVPAGSGVYFAKLTLWGYEFSSSAKLVLQK